MINDRQTIRLTEEQLNQLVESTVEQLLIQEGALDSLKGGVNAVGNMFSGLFNQARKDAKRTTSRLGRRTAVGARKMGRDVANKINQYGQAAADKVGDAVKGAQEFGQDVNNTIKTGAANQNLQASKQKAIEALDNFIKVSRTAPGGLNDNTLNAVKQARTALTRAGGVSKGQYTRSLNKTMSRFK